MSPRRLGLSGRVPSATLPRGAVVWLGAAYVGLTLLVAVHALDGPDRALKQVFRPDLVWSPWQVWAQRIADTLAPSRVVVATGLAVLAVAVRRRSWRPVVLALVVALSTGVLALLSKLALRRPDPNLAVTGAGSYPSGHTVTLVVGVGLVLLLTVGLTRWAWVAVCLAGVLMGSCLVVEGAHWTTDVVGGALLGAAVLATAVVTPSGLMRAAYDAGGRVPQRTPRRGRRAAAPGARAARDGRRRDVPTSDR